MDGFFRKIIQAGYFLIFFLIPLIVLPITSELFEFNKIVLLYFSTLIITTAWIIKMVMKRKIIFRRTILDIPLIIFLIVCSVSVYFSVDPRTSVFGYYSRFNGGLLSLLSYTLLYWAYVSNLNKKDVIATIYVLLASSFLVSLYGILQHFGIDKEIWVQDVQNRVFSTLGQPNWLAAWILSILPFTWTLLLSKKNLLYKIMFILLSSLLFLTLLFTKSRSGIISFFIINFLYIFALFIIETRHKIVKFNNKFKTMLIAEIIFIAIMLLWGTPWTPDLGTLFKRSNVKVEQQNVIGTTSLETGGTDSGVIRKIVWKGAYDVWKNNPIIGTGLETFAHVYYQYRPAEHNLTSEWDYLYNKAHNEYLNYLATTGLLGFFAYIIFITTALLLIIKNIASDIRDQKNPLVHIALILGLLGVLITNFVGFSVVVSSIVIFLFPAMSECLRIEPDNSKLNNRYNFIQVFVVLLILLISIYSAFLITNYWRADIYYAKGRALNDQKLYDEAKLYLVKATNLYPNEPVYLNELAQSDSELAIKAFGEDRNSLAEKYATDAIIESETAVEMSPQNLNIRRSNAAIYIHLSDLDESLSSNVIQSIENSIQYSPTDAKLFYNLGLAYARVENTEKATETLNRAIDLKSDYRDARLALAIIYSQQGEKESAVKHLNYILEKINPEDKMTLQQLHEITGK